MIYTVECYKNTGLNCVNIPESLEWLRSNFEAVNYPSIDILQNEGLQSITIKATWEEARAIDYVVIADECYAATAVPSMSSPDVVILSLVEDPLTSCGGASKLVYLDGMTDRHTVSDDSMFKYTQVDELLAPREQLELESTSMLFDDGEVIATPVESTIDLVKLGKQFNDDGTFNGNGITFSESTSGSIENSVTVPYTEGVSARTMYVIGDATTGPLSPNTRLYEERSGDSGSSYPLVSKGLAAIRSLGTESALISQVAYPKAYIEVQIGDDGQYSFVRGKDQSVDCGLKFKYNDTVQNNRLFYGEYATYGIVTASGAKGEFLPEQIANENDSSPMVRCVADPRPDGKPYFRYKIYKGNSGEALFWVCCLGGLNWASVPLTYVGPSGSYLNEINFTNGAEQASNQYQYNYRQNYQNASKLTNIVNNGITGAAADIGTTLGRLFQKFGGGSIGWGGSIDVGPDYINPNISINGGPTSSIIPNKYAFDYGNQNYTLDQYNLARQRELQNFGVSQSVVAPTVLFPFNANMIRDFVGNGVICYRYKYSDNDIKRVDKLLTMFGYKDTVPLEGSLFSCRKNFDYVSASGVSVGGTDIPMWKRELIAQQLNCGVRVWHVKPDVSYYTNNPIRSTT